MSSLDQRIRRALLNVITYDPNAPKSMVDRQIIVDIAMKLAEDIQGAFARSFQLLPSGCELAGIATLLGSAKATVGALASMGEEAQSEARQMFEAYNQGAEQGCGCALCVLESALGFDRDTVRSIMTLEQASTMAEEVQQMKRDDKSSDNALFADMIRRHVGNLPGVTLAEGTVPGTMGLQVDTAVANAAREAAQATKQ